MNDYLYPMPEGLRGIKSKDDLMKLARLDVEPVWKEQFKALEIIRKALEGKAYFIGASDIGKLKVSFFGRRRYFAPRPLKIVVQYLQLCAE